MGAPRKSGDTSHPMDAKPVGHLPVKQQIEKTLEWISRLTITQGQGSGSPIQILDWQRDFLERLLSAKTTEIGISMARGGGKTTWLAMVAAAYLRATTPASRKRLHRREHDPAGNDRA